MQLSFSDFLCYKCLWTNDFNIDQNCLPRYFNETLIRVEDCKSGCLKSFVYLNDKMVSYTRGCALRTVDRNYVCKEQKDGDNKLVNCFCKEDFCNESYSIKNCSLWNVVCLIFIQIFYKLLT